MSFNFLKIFMVIAYWFVIIKKGEIVENIVLMMKIIISSVLAFNMLMIYLHTCSWLWYFICCYFECQDEGEKWRGAKVQKEWQNMHKAYQEWVRLTRIFLLLNEHDKTMKAQIMLSLKIHGNERSRAFNLA